MPAGTNAKVGLPPDGLSSSGCRFIPADQIPIAYGGLSKPNDPDFTGVEAPPTEVVIKAGEKSTIEIPITEV